VHVPRAAGAHVEVDERAVGIEPAAGIDEAAAEGDELLVLHALDLQIDRLGVLVVAAGAPGAVTRYDRDLLVRELRRDRLQPGDQPRVGELDAGQHLALAQIFAPGPGALDVGQLGGLRHAVRPEQDRELLDRVLGGLAVAAREREVLRLARGPGDLDGLADARALARLVVVGGLAVGALARAPAVAVPDLGGLALGVAGGGRLAFVLVPGASGGLVLRARGRLVGGFRLRLALAPGCLGRALGGRVALLSLGRGSLVARRRVVSGRGALLLGEREARHRHEREARDGPQQELARPRNHHVPHVHPLDLAGEERSLGDRRFSWVPGTGPIYCEHGALHVVAHPAPRQWEQRP
jgi:hypothetical protein